MIDEVISAELVDETFIWLCKQRKHFPANSDIWDFRFHWHTIKPKLISSLCNNTFTFQPLQKVTKSKQGVINLWSSIDSLVLKLLAQVLAKYLPDSQLCTHLKHHGGSKITVTHIHAKLAENTFAFRTDVKSYYESISHEILLDDLSVYIKDKTVMNLLVQYLKRSVEFGGNFTDITRGISSGCPLSPLMASFYLVGLDKEMENKSVYYRRYMDDIIVLAPTRWKLRGAIKVVNRHFEHLKLKQHPDKTTIGRIKKGFDFLGYQFGKEKITVSKRTLQNHIRRLSQLYEQNKHQPKWRMLVDVYRQHWFTWVYAGIPSAIINVDGETKNVKRVFYDRKQALLSQM